MVKGRAMVIAWLALLAAVLGLGAVLASSSNHRGPQAAGLATNPVLDPGNKLSGRAPGFTLTDQFGQRVSLSSFRGRVVILAFNDSQCTTVCPLTTTAMLDAKQMLGAAGSRVQLLGVDANRKATAIKDVRGYSQAHGMLHQWRFLTAPLPRLEPVWKAYGIDVQILRGQIDHTPALFVIGPQGTLEKVYITQMSYASIGQLGQLVAQEVASLLPGHPRVPAKLSYAQIPVISPSAGVVLPRAGGGTVRLGPSSAPRLHVFFATWDSQVLSLRAQLEAVNRYQSQSASAHLPAAVAVDEGSVEPSPAALPTFLHGFARPLSYPVAIDASGRVADGYQVQDEPWFVLTSASGRVIWYYDVATQGPLPAAALSADVRAALRAPPKVSVPSSGAVPSSLAGSPAPLAGLHDQAGRLLGSGSALAARLRRLRGYPVVINAWASWCPPCRSEFPLFASASARYGRRVAFVGVDTNDLSGDAASFLAHHPISYPSYQSSMSQLSTVAPIGYLPTTIFLNREGKVVYVHTGEYAAQGSLDQDVASHAR
ncbi:MAG TPA: redoxin domain-containing protein [Solirubrobacteraceae bacterium]|nr:redoxin domain-containing protein [Solirubrobacteraceae bacterium]